MPLCHRHVICLHTSHRVGNGDDAFGTPRKTTATKMQERFRIFARRISDYTGSSWAFLLAVIVVAAWVAVGPWFGYSNTWQLVINTGTTIITFLMVFLIQNTQNRDAVSTQLKLDELLRAVEQARDPDWWDSKTILTPTWPR